MDSAETDAPLSEPATLDCTIELEFAERVNFAMQQNGVPLVDTVRVLSRSAEPLDDLAVELSLANAEAEPWVGRLSRLDAEGAVSLEPDAFVLSGQALAQRTEAERTEIVCTVSCGLAFCRRACPVDLLPFDHWPGIGHYPDLTAAFVTPNHPEVAALLGVARDAMRGISDSDALDGYQSGSRNRAAQIAEACFNACAAKGIGYINPPASFEAEGQRVRLVDRLLRERLGTCLDLSLLLMSMLEQCGLHPLLLLPEGHAMPAVWTHDAHLPETTIDEPARVRNLIELGEVVPIESTLLTQAGSTFGDSVDAAKRRMESPGSGFCAVDIRAARKRGVRPLPLRVDGSLEIDVDAIGTEVSAKVVGDGGVDRVALAERAERWEAESEGHASVEDESDRIARWQTRLLDLSLRNRLLNFRPTGRTLGLHVPDLPALEDSLADGTRFTLHPKSDTSEAFLREQLEAGQLHAAESAAEMQKRLLTLYRTARLSIEETGANVLYLALGMLKWFESEQSEQARLAPLVLLPITLVRTSSGSGYAYGLQLTDEPLRPNVTLLEKLRAEFGIDTSGLDDLPEDEHGLDVDLVLRNFRAAIRETSRWEVLDEAAIGMFSFNKFLMWKDLKDNLGRLRENRLVRHLVDRPGQDFDMEPFPRADELDEQVMPGEMLCTRDADSSQLAAVRAAGDGRTFVLEGPPGTGKSQTIANIIADSLSRGRRVLFVAEKMAALSVVRKRLEEDGLGPFCLELHSAKASKREVLAQLQEAIDVDTSASPAGWDRLCEQLGETRERLNAYVREMHLPRASGESLYRMLGRLSVLEDGPVVEPPSKHVADASEEQVGAWTQCVADLQKRAGPVDPVSDHALRDIGCSEWSYSLPEEARAVLARCDEALRALDAAARAFLRAVGVDADAASATEDGFKHLALAAAQLQQCPVPPRALVHGPNAEGFRRRAEEAQAVGERRDQQRDRLLERYRSELLGVDPLTHIDAIERHVKRPWILRVFTAGGIKKSLRVYAKSELAPLPTVRDDLEVLAEINRLDGKLADFHDVAACFGEPWSGGASDWAVRRSRLEWAGEFAAILAKIDGDEALADVAAGCADVAASSERATGVGPSARDLVLAWNGWAEAWKALATSLATSSEEAVGAGGWLECVRATLERWSSGLGDLNAWVTWRAARDHAVASGLDDLVDLYEQGGAKLESLDAVFWRSFGTAWFNTIADSVEPVRSFNAAAHTDAVARFRELDARVIALTRAVVAATLSGDAPSAPESASPQSEVGILRRELAKKRRHLPTRRLIEAMPTLLPRLKPCFLMSPLSVAQFLDSALPPFDLVVFDEASQIPVWDSIGAIARGTDVVVVGDSKQLPPTAFFSTLDGDDDVDADDYAVEDTESILKECAASGIPGMRLRWHYRSRHESLIAFSNHFYYQNELHTFPSPQDRSERLGVTLRHVEDGVYDRGGSRTNRIEADRVVDEVVRMLGDPGCTHSLGIVTFNQAQQHLIEDLLDAKRREDPELERFFSNEALEPVFVKNLENVQGDERDAIIFSVGYGPDQTGRPSMNFGPLNKEGGERRLNVAVTRARRQLVVFSSLTSDQIDLRRTQAVGVKHFKVFLDYAAQGPGAIAEAVTESGDRAFDSGFERAVWQALVERGWEVDTQVGCAGYRIDLAVRHPDRPGAYVLGIECDGAVYHSAKTARDRDRIRQSVLEGLGWQIERVWSTDWRINTDGCIARLVATIERALSASDASVAVDIDAQDGPAPEEESGGPAAEQSAVSSAHASLYEDNPGEEASHSESDETEAEGEQYVVARLTTKQAETMDVYEAGSEPVLTRLLAEIVETEGPITHELALRRLAEAVDVKSVRQRFRDVFGRVLASALDLGVVTEADDALWLPATSPASFTSFRRPGATTEAQRDLEDVPLVEIGNAVQHVLRAQFGLPRDELVREAARLFGVKRVTARVGDRFGKALERLNADGRIVDRNGQVTLRVP